MLTYTKAVDTLDTARSKTSGKPVDNHTRLYEHEDGIGVKFHDTFVVIIHDDGTYSLYNGGWNTPSTMDRIEKFSGAKLISVNQDRQGRGDWYVRLEPNPNDPKPEYVNTPIPAPFTAEHPGPEPENPWLSNWWERNRHYNQYIELMTRFHNDKDLWKAERKIQYRARRDYLKAIKEWEARNRIPFYEGIKVNAEGYAPRLRSDGPSPAKLRRHEAAVKKMKARIDKYAKGYIDTLNAGMPMPSGGDCWYCALSQVEDGTPMGDAMPTLHADGSQTIQPNHEHLISHMEEDYYVPSLAVNALRERGYRDVGIMIHLNMHPDEGTMGGGGHGAFVKMVKDEIVSYMRKRLIPQAPTS